MSQFERGAVGWLVDSQWPRYPCLESKIFISDILIPCKLRVPSMGWRHENSFLLLWLRPSKYIQATILIGMGDLVIQNTASRFNLFYMNDRNFSYHQILQFNLIYTTFIYYRHLKVFRVCLVVIEKLDWNIYYFIVIFIKLILHSVGSPVQGVLPNVEKTSQKLGGKKFYSKTKFLEWAIQTVLFPSLEIWIWN
jgi:hypothetical protein